MQVTKGTSRMREQCVPGSLSSSHALEPGNEAMLSATIQQWFQLQNIGVHQRIQYN